MMAMHAGFINKVHAHAQKTFIWSFPNFLFIVYTVWMIKMLSDTKHKDQNILWAFMAWFVI